MIVCKFGGTSLASAENIIKVAEIIKRNPERKMVVVSAPGKRFQEDIKITDCLIGLSTNRNDKEKFDEIYNIIKERFLEIAKKLKVDDSKVLTELEGIKQNILDGWSNDYIVSRGEYLNAIIISEYLGFDFIDAKDFVRLHDDGSVDPDTFQLGDNLIKKRENCVFPGFYGLDSQNKIKTFSRGGSDITGAIVANIVNAECYENWTDVSGLLSADPRLVSSPMSVPEITYRELREMACIGASVFHHDAINPAKIKCIPIKIKNTNAPDDLGTTISTQRNSKNMPVVGVSGKTSYVPVLVEKLNIGNALINSLKDDLVEKGYRTEFTLNGFDSATYYIPVNNKFDPEEIKSILLPKVDNVIFDKKIAMIGIVGTGRSWNNFKQLILSLDEIDIEAINYGGSSATVYIAVKEENYQAAIKKIAKSINEL